MLRPLRQPPDKLIKRLYQSPVKSRRLIIAVGLEHPAPAEYPFAVDIEPEGNVAGTGIVFPFPVQPLLYLLQQYPGADRVLRSYLVIIDRVRRGAPRADYKGGIHKFLMGYRCMLCFPVQ